MNQGRLLTRFVVLLLFIGSITSSIHAQGTNRIVYGTIGNFLVRIDPLTGKATEVAPFAFPGGITSVISIAFDESIEILYGLGGNPGGSGPLRFWRTLVGIDPCTAEVDCSREVKVSFQKLASSFLAGNDGTQAR